MSFVLHRALRDIPARAVHARGVEITDESGRTYIDGSGGAAVSCLGHAHPDVLAAMHRQLDALPYVHTSFFTSEPAEELAADLITHAPARFSHAYFVSGGSEAVEAAVKLARQYFVEIGQPQRRHLIARRRSYHGVTLGALSVGGNTARRAPFQPLLLETSHVSPCFEYREQRADETPDAYGQRLAEELEAEIVRLGPETVAAFVAETVVGATAGAVAPVPGYFRRVREVCDRHGVLLILDEVMCGMGRTGALHAFEQESVRPDLLTIAKGLGGGYAPIGAVLVDRAIVSALRKGSGAFVHGHTYSAHPLACAAALAVQQVIRRDDLLQNVERQGRRLRERLNQRFGQHEAVGDIRGRGLFQAIELVADRETKTPFPAAMKLHARIKQQAMARGLAVYPSGGTADGRAGDHVLIAPPFIVDAAVIDTIVERLGDAVDAALKESPRVATS
jgi:adenosylmethionine-8-amino-7-oxononanoate aminotransferase